MASTDVVNAVADRIAEAVRAGTPVAKELVEQYVARERFYAQVGLAFSTVFLVALAISIIVLVVKREDMDEWVGIFGAIACISAIGAAFAIPCCIISYGHMIAPLASLLGK